MTYCKIAGEGMTPMPMKPREMIKLLQDNGFVEVSQNGSHKKMYKEETNTTVIVPVHSAELKKEQSKIF